MTDIEVRAGTPDDIHPMITLALAACAENGLTNPNPIKLLSEIWVALTRERGIVGIIGEPGKPIEAAILLRIEPLWYSDEPSIIERAIFVHPDFRAAKGGRASKLCDFAKNVQEQLAFPLLIGVLSSQRTEAKVRLYERKFGDAAGAYWIVGASTGTT
jgi:hypothetical protein